MPFKPGDKVVHKSEGKKPRSVVVVAIVGDGIALPPTIDFVITNGHIPKGWYVLQYITNNGIKYDYAPESALELR